jgi:hypothetical protein
MLMLVGTVIQDHFLVHPGISVRRRTDHLGCAVRYQKVVTFFIRHQDGHGLMGGHK